MDRCIYVSHFRLAFTRTPSEPSTVVNRGLNVSSEDNIALLIQTILETISRETDVR